MMQHTYPFRTQAILLAALATASLGVPATATAQERSSLYYRLGGTNAVGRANNPDQLAIRMGLDANLRLNYSCGKFDIGASWNNLMNGFSRLGTTVTNGVQAGIAALPMYALQRAQPGLYQLFQTYSQKADALVATSLASCEQMESEIQAGGNPYEKYMQLAKGEGWKAQANTGGDLVQAKIDINSGKTLADGIQWVFKNKAGGANQKPLEPVRDLSVAGYLATLNKPTTMSATTNFATGTGQTPRLVSTFKTPQDLANWNTRVLGDQQIVLCNASDAGCPPTGKTTSTSTGLGPEYEKQIREIQPLLQGMVSATKADYKDLQRVSSPGMALSSQVVDSIRSLPAQNRAMATERVVQELAVARTIDQALVARSALLVGMSLPEAVVAAEATKEVQAKIDLLTKYINDLMFEHRTRKELLPSSALTLMGVQQVDETAALTVPGGARKAGTPMLDGRAPAK